MKTTPSDLHSSAEVLNSWKEIAAYLKRGVRTVQRWEAELGLPVRRPWGRSRSAVLAMRSELDLWVRACPKVETAGQVDGAENGNAAPPEFPLTERRTVTLELISTGRQLRENLDRSREQVVDAMEALMDNIRRMTMHFPQDRPCNSAELTQF